MNEIHVTIVRVERRSNSVNGNPRYKVYIQGDDMPYFTEKDAGWVYAINWHSVEGGEYTLVVRGSTIVDIK